MITKLKKELKKDEGLYLAYQANIAMAYYDASYHYKKKNQKKVLSQKDILAVSNIAAKNFLDLLIK